MTKDAQKRFEHENEIEEQKVYEFTDDDIQAKLRSKYWRADPETFKKVKISAVALIKMTMHARAGGDIEVMGLMQGYPDGDTIWVMDAFGLPVEACETRVNAGKEADGFMIEHFD
jgi:COP9 signalosome complex subunit 5